MKSILYTIVLITALTACNQPQQTVPDYTTTDKIESENSSSAQSKSTRNQKGRVYAENELKAALLGKSDHNVIDHKTNILADSLTAIKVADAVLFSTYGKENVMKQRPYESYLVDNYWIVLGTLPESTSNHVFLGGTFLVIIDARDCRIVRLTHGR